jgi:hypothetical protein
VEGRKGMGELRDGSDYKTTSLEMSCRWRGSEGAGMRVSTCVCMGVLQEDRLW